MKSHICYKDIPKYINAVSKDSPPEVLVSKFQAYLHKKLIEQDDRPLSLLGRLLDRFVYGIILIVILIAAKNLFFLSYFHYIDKKSIEGICYKDVDDKVLISFKSDIAH